MTFTDTQIAALKAPLDKSHVKQRAQAGRQLSYIEGWHAIAEANRIFGHDNWHRRTEEMRQVCEPYKDQTDKWRVAYAAKVSIRVICGEGYADREGWGYGSGIDKDLGSAHESAIKEAETDAMKRALMTFGNPFGLALYDKDQANVVDGNRTTADTLIAALKLSKDEAELNKWASDNKAAIDGLPGPLQDEVRHAFSVHRSSLRYQAERAA